METNGSNNMIMKFWNHFIDMEMYTDKEITSFLENNEYNQITVYLRDGKNRKEIIKDSTGKKMLDDDFSNVSFSDKFLEWVTVIARK